MKRIGHLYETLLDKTFIKSTIEKASKHKLKRRKVHHVLRHIDEYVNRTYEMIKSNKIRLAPTRTKIINERGKERLITISPFYPNQILDYMLVEIIKPFIKQSMYQYCVGNVDKRGIVYGKKVVEKEYKKYKYFMKLDIHHFYQNVKPHLLIQSFSRRIKDVKFLNFMKDVINKNELLIGCYYSQWTSNYYLQEFDHYVKEALQVPFYIRYVDDMVLMGNNKRKLLAAYYKMNRYLNDKLQLEFKFRPIVRDTNTSDLSFLGFKFSKDETKLRHNIFYKVERTIRKVDIHLNFSLAKRLVSYFSWLKNTKIGYNYYKNNIEPVVRFGYLRKIISKGGIRNGKKIS